MENITAEWEELLDFLGLPKTIKGMNKAIEMEELHLSERNLDTLPDSIGLLKKLFYLNCGYNNLVSLPESMSNLTNLQYLDCGYNKLTQLPEGLSNLEKLEMLNVSYNKLTSLPTGFREDVCIASYRNLF